MKMDSPLSDLIDKLWEDDLRRSGGMDLIEAAWGLIANAGEGNWETQTSDWQEAAAKWRDNYHKFLDGTLEGEVKDG